MNKRIIKILATFSLLIFFAPFYQTCSDSELRSPKAFVKEPVLEIDTTNVDKKKIDELLFQARKKLHTRTGYDLALENDSSTLLIFTIMMILNFTVWVKVLLNQFKSLLIILFFNFILISLALGILIYYSTKIGQIRYGLILYFLNIIFLFIFVYRENIEKTAHNTG